MLFKKKKIIEKRYCTKCKTGNGKLVKYSKSINLDGDTVQYYTCTVCNAERHMQWYYKKGNKKKVLVINRRYLAKKEAK